MAVRGVCVPNDVAVRDLLLGTNKALTASAQPFDCMLRGVQEKSSVVEQFPIIRLCIHMTARQIGSDNNFRVADHPRVGPSMTTSAFIGTNRKSRHNSVFNE